MKTSTTKFIVRSDINPALVLCTDGEFHVRSLVGPGGWCPKVYKTEAGAKRSNPGRVVEPITEG